jgi:hypothetical protein
MYSLMNAPILGGVGLVKGIIDPATTSVAADMFNIVAPEALEIQ